MCFEGGVDLYVIGIGRRYVGGSAVGRHEYLLGISHMLRHLSDILALVRTYDKLSSFEIRIVAQQLGCRQFIGPGIEYTYL